MIVLSSLMARAAKVAGGGALGLIVLGFVADHCGSPTGEAVVHVVEPQVEVTIGGNSYVVRERRYEPIVCELPVGRHELTVSRHGLVLHREAFWVDGGASIVLTAWVPTGPEGASGD